MRPALLLALALPVLGLLAGAPPPAAAGPARAKAYTVADFESRSDVAKVVAEGFAVERIQADVARDGHHLRAVAQEDAAAYALHFDRVPRDVRKYEALAFRVRTLLSGAPPLQLGFVDTDGRRLETTVPSPKEVFTDVRILLANMDAHDEFDAKGVERLSLTGEGAGAFELDDLRLVRGHGDWQTDGAVLLEAFGEKRVKKAVRVRTEHFDIFTDSTGARRKFPKALEETYDFVIASLGVPEMTSRLPVYIFQSKGLYTEFCVRFAGWSRQAGHASAGHASARYFATYYQAPKSPVVTHELTHAIFHRTVGAGGGSWFQEGVAVYVEELSQGKSAAKLFAPKVRSGQYAPLDEFVVIPRLIGSADAKGGAFTSGSLYAQAGAFFEFLLRGPLLRDGDEADARGDGLPAAVQTLARGGGRDRVALVEKRLGCSLAELERAWVEWGGRPPKQR